MKSQDVLREQLQRTRDLAAFAMAGLTDEQLFQQGEGTTIQPMANIYAHLVTSEDALVNLYARQQPMLFEREGWAEKTGLTFAPDVVEIGATLSETDFEALKEYAQAVYAETDAFIEGLSDEDLDQPVAFGDMGEFPLGIFLGSFVVWHFMHHVGELSALKGTLGGQGLPF